MISSSRRPLAVPIHCPHCVTSGTIDIAETVTLSATFKFDEWRVPVCASCNRYASTGRAAAEAMTHQGMIDLFCTAVRKAPQEAKHLMARRDHERSEKVMAIYLVNHLERTGLVVTKPTPPAEG